MTFLNQTAPDFTLQSSTGERISLSELAGDYVVLVFYPKNDTPVCNRQLTDFSDALADLNALGCRVFGINPASAQKHQDFCARKALHFPLLSDPGGEVAKLYKAYMGWLPINKRTVVVIDPSQKICFYERGTPRPEKIANLIQSRQKV